MTGLGPEPEEFVLAERRHQAWREVSRPGRLRPGDPGEDQLAFGMDDDEVVTEHTMPMCGIRSCNRAPGHDGPHRVYDTRSFTVRQEFMFCAACGCMTQRGIPRCAPYKDIDERRERGCVGLALWAKVVALMLPPMVES
jgi:hypothetical protein